MWIGCRRLGWFGARSRRCLYVQVSLETGILRDRNRTIDYQDSLLGRIGTGDI